MARPSAPMMRPAPQMRQVAPVQRQAPRQFQATPRQLQTAPRQFQAGPRQQMSPRQMSPRQVAPSQRVSPRLAGPRDGRPKGDLRRGVVPRQGIAGERGKAGSRAAERRELRQQSGGKSKLIGRENARERAAERRQERIERKQRAVEDRKQRAIERKEAIDKVRDNRREERKDARQERREERQEARDRRERVRDALVRRGKGDRDLVLRNRAFADRKARNQSERALAQATFGGRYADRFRDGARDRHDRRRWRHRHIHVIGWLGPVFWPYAYADFVDYTFWPHAYDAFWPYAYDDVYEGFFGYYAVGGPAYDQWYAGGGYASSGNGPPRTTGARSGSGGPRTAARPPAAGAAQICTGETSGLTDWPIERIVQVVNPNDEQRAALNELAGAASRAIDVLRSACPDDLPSTPAGRMAAMRQRLEAMREAVQIVRPALERFYASLSDEQRARFDAIEPNPGAAQATARKGDLSQVCSQTITKTSNTPVGAIEKALRLSPEQRQALENLDAATAKSAEMLAASCPTEETLTPPGRLAAMEGRLNAMLQALDVVQPALVDFYGSLSDEQKARFNQLGVRRQASR
ncbi:MAG: Spy/CpxP family protein refolding chaperone [Xanthobacteraceae bacterium]|nr:Spy/CpxP family protein refolding chaperone [Xanthobacteraceae bacterium]